MNSNEARTVQTFWLVTVCNKELPDEPDIGLAVSLGSDVAAEELGQSMVDELASAGHGRCVYRVHKLEAGRAYRAGALLGVRRRRA